MMSLSMPEKLAQLKELFAMEAGRNKVLPIGGGLFIPVLRESMEMLYQFERDYRFDSSKVERTFGLAATACQDGIQATLKD